MTICIPIRNRTRSETEHNNLFSWTHNHISLTALMAWSKNKHSQSTQWAQRPCDVVNLFCWFVILSLWCSCFFYPLFWFRLFWLCLGKIEPSRQITHYQNMHANFRQQMNNSRISIYFLTQEKLITLIFTLIIIYWFIITFSLGAPGALWAPVRWSTEHSYAPVLSLSPGLMDNLGI